MLFLEGEWALQFVTECTISSINTLQRAVWIVAPNAIGLSQTTSYVVRPARSLGKGVRPTRT
jgi:hypothetical protein